MNPCENSFSSISVVPASQAGANAVSEGSTVFVRVLAAEGGNRYTVSFAGQRFSVLSRHTLQRGLAFRAEVRAEKGQVLLIPERSLSAMTDDSVQRFSSLYADSSGKLFSFLQQLGLPADSISFRLVQFFQENGIKFNGGLALKARTLAKRFKGSEEDAAEAALFLLSKGIEPDEEKLAYVLNLLYAGGASVKNRPNFFSKERQSGPAAFDADGGFLPLLYENAEESLSLPPGLLSFLNQYKSAGKHWVILPFEYSSDITNFAGVIRLFINLEQKKTEKILISAFSSVRNYFFMVYFNKQPNRENKIRLNIDYCMNPAVPEFAEGKLSRLLENLLKDADARICYRRDLFSAGCFTGMPDLSFVEVRA